MAVIVSEDFEDGTPGEAVTTGNTTFDVISPEAPTFSSLDAITGTQSMRVNPTAPNYSVGQWIYGETPLTVLRVYVKMLVALPVAVNPVFVKLGSTTQASMRINTALTVSVRNGSIATWTSTTALPLDAWARIEWRIESGVGQQVRIYRDDNLHGVTPTEDSGTQAYSQFNMERHWLGNATGSTGIDYLFDAATLDDAMWPGSAVVMATTPTDYLWDGTTWVPLVTTIAS